MSMEPPLSKFIFVTHWASFIGVCSLLNQLSTLHPRLETQDYDDICAGRATAIKDENHVYQTLKLNEVNYESMYAKIMPTKK